MEYRIWRDLYLVPPEKGDFSFLFYRQFFDNAGQVGLGIFLGYSRCLP